MTVFEDFRLPDMKENFINVALVGMFISLLTVTATVTWRIASMNAFQIAHDAKDGHNKAKEWNDRQEYKIVKNATSITKIEIGLEGLSSDMDDLEGNIRELKNLQNYNFTRLIRLLTKEQLPADYPMIPSRRPEE